MLRAAAALWLVLVCLGGWSSAQAQATDECAICPMGSPGSGWWSTQMSSKAHGPYSGGWSCRMARLVACEGKGTGDRCWVDFISGGVMSATEAVVKAMPKILTCGQVDCPSGGIGGPIAIAFIAAIMLTMVIRMGHAMTTAQPWTGHLQLILGAAVIMAIAIAMSLGLVEQIWSVVGQAVALGGEVGLAFREVGQTSLATKACGLGTPSGADSWGRVEEILKGMTMDMLDLAGVMVGVGVSFVPDLRNLFGGAVKFAWSMFTSADLGIILQITRFLIAMALIMYGVRMIAGFVVVLLEGVVMTGFAMALLPIGVWLAFWKGMRGALFHILGTILYTALLYAAAGITLTIGRLTMAVGMRIFVNSTAVDGYPVAQMNGLVGTGAGKCQGYANMVRIDDGTPLDVYKDFNHHLCLLSAPPGPDTAKYASKLIVDPEFSVMTWLPAAVILLAAGAVTVAVLKYTRVAATEVSGRSLSAAATQSAEALSKRLSPMKGM